MAVREARLMMVTQLPYPLLWLRYSVDTVRTLDAFDLLMGVGPLVAVEVVCAGSYCTSTLSTNAKACVGTPAVRTAFNKSTSTEVHPIHACSRPASSTGLPRGERCPSFGQSLPNGTIGPQPFGVEEVGEW